MSFFGTDQSSNTSDGAFGINQTIVGGGMFPASSGTLSKAWIYGSRYDATFNHVRVGVYQGGTSDTDPSGATLIDEALILMGSNGSQWFSATLSGSLAASTRTWIAVRSAAELTPEYCLTGDRADATYNMFSWSQNSATTAFESTLPAVSQISTSAFKWAIEYSTGGTTITPQAGSIVFIGVAPTVTAIGSVTRTPSVGLLAFTGFAPTVIVSGSPVITPSAGTLSLTGIAPTMALTLPSPASGALTLTGYAPTVSVKTTITPNAGALDFTGIAPTILTIGSVSITPAAGALVFDGITAQVLNSMIAAGHTHRHGFGFGFR